MTEIEIIKGCKKDDRRSQSALYKLYYPLMRNIVSRYTTSEDDKSRLINAGFYKVLKNISKYKQEYTLATWIRNVMVNNCIDEYRKTQSKILDIHIEELNDVPVLVDYNSGLKELEEEDLLSILNNLPTMAKTVFNLYAIDGYKHNEISKMLSINASTSRWHLNFARNKLKALLETKTLGEKKMIEIAK
jgi:RNA polymerase sigma factor (sigma-70 family)